MQTEETIKLSISKNFKDKRYLRDKRAFSEGFEPSEITIDELAEVVSSGLAFSYQFKDGKRSSKNLVATDFLTADFDGGTTLDEALNLDIVKAYGSLCYTTASHSVDEHRFRVVFVLPRTITDAKEVRFAARALAQRLGSDPAATDAARISFGATGCETWILGSRVTEAFLDELIEDGRLEASTFRTNGNTPAGHRAYLRIKPEQLVRLRSGVQLPFGQVRVQTSVYCPFHPDKRASAFISQSKGDSYLHCSACDKTWWSTEAKTRHYDFNSFENILKLLKQDGLKKTQSELIGLEEYFGEDVILPPNITVMNERYLDASKLNVDPVKLGVTLIKSPKGSGKTTFLAGLLKTVTQRFASLEDLEEKEDPDAAPEPFYSDQKVLLIGHRQALIGELCQRLKLNCYLDYVEKQGSDQLTNAKRRFGVCLDSLRRVEGIKYDVVVIDEVEQVLGHFLSDTIGAARSRIFEIFAELIIEARHVIALDADLGWSTYNTLKRIKSLSAGEGATPTLENKNCPFNIVLNGYIADQRELDLYANKNHLVAKLRADILDGKRVFVTSNSKKQVDTLSMVVEALATETNTDIPTLAITSSNSNTADAQDFIRNVSRRILDYQVVLASPSLGTGIDITFDKDQQEIDTVFGLFETGVTDHFDIDQQIARVRNPKETCVWVNPQCANYETTFEVVVDDVLRGDLVGGMRYGARFKDRATIADEDPFLTMAALLTAKYRASQNNLKRNFINHKQSQGWTVHLVDKDDALADEGKLLQGKGKALSFAEEVDRLTQADVLKQNQYLELRRRLDFENSPVSEAERFNMRRTSLELFYREKASADLIAADNGGRQRGQVLLFEAVRAHVLDPKHFRAHLSEDATAPLRRTSIETIPNRAIRAALLHELLMSTPVYHNGRFDVDTRYSHTDLLEFAKLSQKLQRFVAGQFKISTRRDVDEKPIQHFGSILALLGLKHEPAGSAKINGERIRYYVISSGELGHMESVMRQRQEIDDWQYLNKTYEFHYSTDEIEEISKMLGNF